MEPDIVYDYFYEVETDRGVWYVPYDGGGEDWRDDPIPLLECTGGQELIDAKVVCGYFARLSAPGYMDSTDWHGPYDTENDALEALREVYGD